jgi:hypothetical protein
MKIKLAFEMEQHIGLVILEHLGDELDVHVLDVDFLPGCELRAAVVGALMDSYLETLVQHHDGLVELLLRGPER